MPTLYQIKEQALSYQPLMLAKFTLTDGTIARYSTHGLRSADNGFPYNGNDYLPRIINTKQAATQAMSEQGIDTPPSVTLRLADSDRSIFRNLEKEIGFKGADLQILFVFWNAGTSEFSSNELSLFNGVCDGAKLSGNQLSITANSKMNMQRIALPSARIQKTCGWQFPRNSAERTSAATDSSKLGLYRCGYSPDVSGANARGTYQSGSTPYTVCTKTKTDCVARGMYTQDSAGRVTGRFGGIQWDPPNQYFVSREYTSGNMVPVYNTPNEAKYNSFFPDVLGTCWVDPPITSFVGDANYTKFEVVLAVGYIGDQTSVLRVVCNDVEIPYASPSNKTAWWSIVNAGTRNGFPNPDQFFSSKGDPYGSLACISIVVPRRLADSGSAPRVRVLLKGPGMRVYSAPDTFTESWTDNSAWIILALLIRARWKYDQINLQSFIDSAAICDTAISGKSIFGGTFPVRRYSASLALVQRRSAAEIIRGVRMACKGLLIPGPNGLELRIQQTLADQQPSPVAGSNYNSPIASKTAAGVTKNGYVAYDFNESNILPAASGSGGDTSLEITQLSIAEQPNVIGFSFPNSQNSYAQDGITQIDTTDLARVGQEITSTLQMEGIVTYDQALRAIATYRAELSMGNARGDSSGTFFFGYDTSFRALHLKMGDICRYSDLQNGISNQLIRILEIEPDTNYERVRLKARWHNDDWYTDAWGQDGVPGYSGQGRAKLLRPPFPWLANYEAPWPGDSMFPETEKFFGIAQTFEELADFSILATLPVTGYMPVNSFSSGSAAVRPPYISFQGTTASAGGSLPGNRTYYVSLCAKDTAGKYSVPSAFAAIYVPDGTNANTITVSIDSWDTATAGFAVFVSDQPGRMSFQGESGSLPASITASGVTPESIVIKGPLNVASWGLPDVEYDRMEVRVKRIVNGGLWGLDISGMATGSLTFGGGEGVFGTDNYAGYDITLYAKMTDGSPSTAPVPIINRTIASNTDKTLMLTANLPSNADVDIQAGDVWVLRSKPTNITANSLEDPLWQNAIYPDGLGDLTGCILRFIAGTARGTTAKIASNTATAITIEGTWQVTPDSTSRYVIEEPAWGETVYSTSTVNADPHTLVTMPVNVNNYVGSSLLISPVPLDGEDTEAFESLSQVREIYLRGIAGSLGAVGGDIQVSF